MNAAEILRLYERERRIEGEPVGLRREASSPNIVRLVDLNGRRGCVNWSRLGAAEVEAAIREQIKFYQGLNQSFEWKVHGNDGPEDLKDRLRAAGFAEEPEETIMALELARAPAALLAPVKHEMKRANDAGLLEDVVEVQEGVWQEKPERLIASLRETLRTTPQALTLHVAYQDGRPVASGWIDFEPRTQFSGIWGGSVLPEFRGRGFYRSLLATRVQEALSRGRRFLTIDAGPMSRPIVERFGFQVLTTAQGFMWHPAGAAGK